MSFLRLLQAMSYAFTDWLAERSERAQSKRRAEIHHATHNAFTRAANGRREGRA